MWLPSDGRCATLWAACSAKGETVNGHWSRSTRYFVMSVLLIAVIAFVISIRSLLGPLIIAALIAYLLSPFVGRLERHTRMHRRAAATTVYGFFLLLLLLGSFKAAPVVAAQARTLADEFNALRPQLQATLAEPVDLLGIELNLSGLPNELDQASDELFRPERVFRILKSATENLLWILVILVTSYTLLQDWPRLRDWLIGLIPDSHQGDSLRILGEVQLVWGSYLRGQLILMLIVGLTSGLAAVALGLPRAALLGLLAGGLDLIPSLGPAVAMAVAALDAWLEGSNWLLLPRVWFTMLVVAVFNLIQLVEYLWLQPRIIGQRLKVHRGFVFLAVVGALAIGSALLALIIVPSLVSAGIVARYLYRRTFGMDPWPPEAHSAQAARGHDPGARTVLHSISQALQAARTTGAHPEQSALSGESLEPIQGQWR